MTAAYQATDDTKELQRLRDEVEQLQTALEASSDDVDRLVEERDRLLQRVTSQARELQAANSAYVKASATHDLTARAGLAAQMQTDQDQEELRVAFEEMQVLTEELETANNSLQATNRALDERVEERTRELETKNRALVESEIRFRALVEGMPQLVWRSIDGSGWTWASPQWTTYTGLGIEESLGFGWLAALHPDDREPAMAAWSEADATVGLAMEGRIFHRAERRYRHFRTRAMAVFGSRGEVLEWLGTSTDVDDLLMLQDRQAVLVAELQHRTRNLLGVVSSLADRTGAASADLADFRTRFRDRIEALSRVQGLLSRLNDHDRVTFDELIQTELAALDGTAERVTLDGPPDVRLRSSTVQTLAMALHELATNALKYGAFKHPSGHLAIRWRMEPDDDHGVARLHVDWRETGVDVPPDTAPQSRGQGRELIERALPYQLGARTTYALAAGGVHCTISIPVSTHSREQDHG